MVEIDRIYNEDCLEGMKRLDDRSVDLIVADLPYGTSSSEWDIAIPLDGLWAEYRRVIRPERAIVLFSQQPFTTTLISSNMKMWKYNWVWEKESGSNFINSHYCPLKVTEDICVFGTGAVSYVKNGETLIYHPQFSEGKPYVQVSGQQRDMSAVVHGGKNGRDQSRGHETVNEGVRYPMNLLRFNRDKDKIHPTQKPVALIEYLIRTYSNEGDLVLDNCMGSGTTAIAAMRCGRHYVGFELNKDYYLRSLERISAESVPDAGRSAADISVASLW